MADMTKTDLVEAIAEQTGMKKADSERALEAFLDTVSTALSRGQTVQVTGFADRLDRDDMLVPDVECLLARMDSGAHVHCTASWATAGRADDLLVRGSEGTIEARPYDRSPLLLHRGGQTESFDLEPAANWHLPLIDDFARAIVEGRAPEFTGRDGLQASRMMEGCYRSSATGETVSV